MSGFCTHIYWLQLRVLNALFLQNTLTISLLLDLYHKHFWRAFTFFVAIHGRSCFCCWWKRVFHYILIKGTVSQDFRPLFFLIKLNILLCLNIYTFHRLKVHFFSTTFAVSFYYNKQRFLCVLFKGIFRLITLRNIAVFLPSWPLVAFKGIVTRQSVEFKYEGTLPYLNLQI